MRLFLILAAVPIIEIYLFLEVGALIGTWPTIGIVVLTALIGSILLRQQGLAALGDVQSRLAAGEAPGRLLADGAMILVAGVLLLTPGFFTDTLGLALLLPPARAVVWRYLSTRVKVVGSGHVSATWHFRSGGGARGSGGGTTVDGTFTEAETPSDDERPPENPPLGRPRDER